MSEKTSNFEERVAEHVVDPDAYNRTQRFKEIHKARQRIADFTSNMTIPKDAAYYDPEEGRRLAHLVSFYIYELEPLIEASKRNEEEFLVRSDRLPYQSLTRWAMNFGDYLEEGKWKSSSPRISLLYFAAANRFYSQIGMDLELDTGENDKGFDYSDLLETGPPGTPQLEVDGGPEEGDGE